MQKLDYQCHRWSSTSLSLLLLLKSLLSSGSLSSLSLPSPCRSGGSQPFFFRVNGLAGPESGRLANVKITSLPGGTGSESSGMISSGSLCFCRVWLKGGLRGNCLDLVVGILPHVEVQDIRAAVIEEMLKKKKNKNLDYTVKSWISGVKVGQYRQRTCKKRKETCS